MTADEGGASHNFCFLTFFFLSKKRGHSYFAQPRLSYTYNVCNLTSNRPFVKHCPIIIAGPITPVDFRYDATFSHFRRWKTITKRTNYDYSQNYSRYPATATRRIRTRRLEPEFLDQRNSHSFRLSTWHFICPVYPTRKRFSARIITAKSSVKHGIF